MTLLLLGAIACGLWAALLVRSVALRRRALFFVMPVAGFTASAAAALTASSLSGHDIVSREFILLASTMSLGALLLGGAIALFVLFYPDDDARSAFRR